MDKKRVKKKKRKLSFKKIFRFIFIIAIFYIFISYLLNIPIKNIYITNNDNISDKEILNLSKLINYPSFFKTSKNNIKNNLLKNEFIKNVTITKKYGYKVFIDIEEYKVICYDKNINKLYLENGNKVENIYNITDSPILVNDIGNLYDEFINKFSLVDKEILLKISEIEYTPVEVDKERFLLRMKDENYVYITFSKIKNLNKYNEIYDEMDGRKGIIYLDSGNYVEIKE